jgi:D-amino-acid dehydrogenase
MQGTLQLFREQAQLDACAKDVKALAADGVPFEVLDRDGCIRVEPALTDVRHKIVGGLLTPKDETGDCFKFATALAAKAKDLGARFAYGTNIEGLDIESGRVRGVCNSTRDAFRRCGRRGPRKLLPTVS